MPGSIIGLWTRANISSLICGEKGQTNKEGEEYNLVAHLERTFPRWQSRSIEDWQLELPESLIHQVPPGPKHLKMNASALSASRHEIWSTAGTRDEGMIDELCIEDGEGPYSRSTWAISPSISSRRKLGRGFWCFVGGEKGMIGEERAA
jgi:hypothetical protein